MQEPVLPAATGSILLVDDEPLVRAGTALLLEEIGYDVVQASTAAEGLQRLKENDAIEILITDFRMPDMNGAEMIALAKQMLPEIRAILMTGYDADDERFADVAAPRLSKPFSLDDLETALRQSR